MPTRKMLYVDTDPQQKDHQSHPELTPDSNYCEIGLGNFVIQPEPGTIFNGKELTEEVNVVLKLKTKSSQPKVESDTEFYSWINPPHLVKAVKYWKQKFHPSLVAVSFPDIQDESGWDFSWSAKLKKTNEEKMIRSWKHLSTKPYHSLTRYHKKFLEKNDISSEEDMERKFPVPDQKLRLDFEY